MGALPTACLLLAACLAASLAGERLPAPWRRLPLLLLGVGLGFLGMELARYDPSDGEALFWIGFVVAPVVVIFGGAAAGARRWYGWPDLGPWPGRLAGVLSLLLLGVLVGTRVKEEDVRATAARGERIREQVVAWRGARDGAWPATLADAAPDAPSTRMGILRPPPFLYDPRSKRLEFPLDGRRKMALPLDAKDAPWTLVR